MSQHQSVRMTPAQYNALVNTNVDGRLRTTDRRTICALIRGAGYDTNINEQRFGGPLPTPAKPHSRTPPRSLRRDRVPHDAVHGNGVASDLADTWPPTTNLSNPPAGCSGACYVPAARAGPVGYSETLADAVELLANHLGWLPAPHDAAKQPGCAP